MGCYFLILTEMVKKLQCSRGGPHFILAVFRLFFFLRERECGGGGGGGGGGRGGGRGKE